MVTACRLNNIHRPFGLIALVALRITESEDQRACGGEVEVCETELRTFFWGTGSENSRCGNLVVLKLVRLLLRLTGGLTTIACSVAISSSAAASPPAQAPCDSGVFVLQNLWCSNAAGRRNCTRLRICKKRKMCWSVVDCVCAEVECCCVILCCAMIHCCEFAHWCHRPVR